MKWTSPESNPVPAKRELHFLYSALACVFIFALGTPAANSEYADIVLNQRSEQEGQRPVIFPHWFHRIRFQCRVCHTELGFEMRAGANDVTMDEISKGKFCGACHNGDIAWSVDNCGLCHSALSGTPAGVIGSHQTSGPGNW